MDKNIFLLFPRDPWYFCITESVLPDNLFNFTTIQFLTSKQKNVLFTTVEQHVFIKSVV